MKFRIRVDRSSDDDVTSFCERYSSYVIVHHVLPYGNPHYHAYVDDTMSMSIDAFRARVKRFFKPETRSDYSVKICDDDKVNEYVGYLFNTKHGNVARLVSYKFDNDLLAECKEAAKSISDDYSKRATERKSKGPTIYDIAVEVNEVFQGQDTIANWTNTAIDVLHRHRKTCEPNMLIKIVSTAKSFKDKEFLVRKVQNYFQEN